MIPSFFYVPTYHQQNFCKFKKIGLKVTSLQKFSFVAHAITELGGANLQSQNWLPKHPQQDKIKINTIAC